VTFDLDAVLAERRDNKPPFEFTFDGETYYLPPHSDIRADAVLMSAGGLNEGLRLLLGPEQWERMKQSTKTFDYKSFLKLYDAYQTYTGEDLGESEASSSS
jgi:hypothetical protein